MASSVDFAAWVTPALEVTLGGKTYLCPPPSVAQARIIVAFAALSEVRLGLAEGPADAELVALADAQSDSLPTLTLGAGVCAQMEADNVDAGTRDRVGYYAMNYWAHGKERADWLAEIMWSAAPAEGEGEDSPKASPRRPSRSGRSTGSANRTRTASTRTTASPKT